MKIEVPGRQCLLKLLSLLQAISNNSISKKMALTDTPDPSPPPPCIRGRSVSIELECVFFGGWGHTTLFFLAYNGWRGEGFSWMPLKTTSQTITDIDGVFNSTNSFSHVVLPTTWTFLELNTCIWMLWKLSKLLFQLSWLSVISVVLTFCFVSMLLPGLENC